MLLVEEHRLFSNVSKRAGRGVKPGDIIITTRCRTSSMAPHAGMGIPPAFTVGVVLEKHRGGCSCFSVSFPGVLPLFMCPADFRVIPRG